MVKESLGTKPAPVGMGLSEDPRKNTLNTEHVGPKSGKESLDPTENVEPLTRLSERYENRLTMAVELALSGIFATGLDPGGTFESTKSGKMGTAPEVGNKEVSKVVT